MGFYSLSSLGRRGNAVTRHSEYDVLVGMID